MDIHGRIMQAAGEWNSHDEEAEVQVKEAADSLDIGKLTGIVASVKAIHVATRSYARHMALDTAFDDLAGAADTLMESIQGKHVLDTGKRYPAKASSYKMDIPDDTKDGTLAAVKNLYKDFVTEAGKFTKGDSALESALDDARVAFCQLAYRLDLTL